MSHKLKHFVFITKLAKSFTLIQVRTQFIETWCHKSVTVYEPELNMLTYFFTSFISQPFQLDIDLGDDDDELFSWYGCPTKGV